MPFQFMPAPHLQTMPMNEPMYQMGPQQQRMSQPQARANPQAQRSGGNGRYLPAMPEMLNPQSRQAAQPRPNPPANNAVASTKGAGSNVVIRGQGGEEPASVPVAKLSIPAPEELGLLTSASPQATPASGPMDWAGAKAHLEKLGATHYRLEKATEGWCFVCALSHPQQPSAQRQFEAHAATEAEAIRSLLKQVEEWRATGK